MVHVSLKLIRMYRVSRSLGLCTCAAATLLAGGGSPVAARTATPAKDTFSGSITRATGRLSGDHGNVTILIHVVQSTDRARRIGLTFKSRACGSAKHCLSLSGRLSGTISARRAGIPDVGRRFDLKLAGTLTGLGQVSATGVVVGVGFIRAGHEMLTLDLRAKVGSVTIAAISPKVPGFTSP